MEREILKYKSNYSPIVTYKSDKNFLVRLKCLLETRMREAGYNCLNDKFETLIQSIDGAEDYLFHSKKQK